MFIAKFVTFINVFYLLLTEFEVSTIWVIDHTSMRSRWLDVMAEFLFCMFMAQNGVEVCKLEKKKKNKNKNKYK